MKSLHLSTLFILLSIVQLIACSTEPPISSANIDPIENNFTKTKMDENINTVVLPSDNPDTILTMHGSNTIGQKLAPKLVSEYLTSLGAPSVLKMSGKNDNETVLQAYIPSSNKIVAVNIHAHGSSTSFAGFQDKDIDIGMSSRPIKESERSALFVKHGDLSLPENEIVLAMDGLSIIVHPSNGIELLTISQLADIFSGKISNWSQLGGENLPILLYARDNKSGTYDTFKYLVLKSYKTQLSKQSNRFESNKQLSQEVNENPGSIGFTGMAYVLKNKVLKIASSHGSKYIAPTNFQVNTETYPLARRLFLYKSARNKTNSHIDQFIKFTTSKTGQNIVKKEKFVSQNIFKYENLNISNTPKEYKNATKNLARLSLNFRLKPNVSTLDSKSHRDLDRLANFLKQHNISDVTAIGFTGNMSYEKDPLQNIKSNLQRSLRLSYMISFGLRERGIRNVKTIGLGTMLPIVADDDKNTIIKNSRVEIWINSNSKPNDNLNKFALNQ